MKNVFSPLHAVLVATLLAAPLAYGHAQTAAAPEALLQTIQALGIKNNICEGKRAKRAIDASQRTRPVRLRPGQAASRGSPGSPSACSG